MKVTLILPYLRPEGAKRCILSVKENAGIPEDDYEIIAEEDTERIGCPKMVKRLTDKAKGETIFFLADDTILGKDFLRIALDKMKEFPDGWGLVAVNDTTPRQIAGHWLAHRKMLPLLDGEFFHTGYEHCYCDNELTDRCIALNRFLYCEESVIIHPSHPYINQGQMDEYYEVMYEEARVRRDSALYKARKKSNWAVRQKILVCGNGPSLLTQLNYVSLDHFDKVVRVNVWRPIEGYDNRCDAWVFYPLHALGESESQYDLTPYLAKAKELWVAHPFLREKCKEVTQGRDFNHALTDEQLAIFKEESGLHTPRTGILALYMATLISDEVYAAGFDCYQGDRAYYYSDVKPDETNKPHDEPLAEKAWYDEQIKLGRIKELCNS